MPNPNDGLTQEEQLALFKSKNQDVDANAQALRDKYAQDGGKLNFEGSPPRETFTEGKGELRELDGSSDAYKRNDLRYPTNIGSKDVPHWVIFNIYVPEGDKYAIETFGSSDTPSRSQQNIDYLNSPENKQGGTRGQEPITGVGIGTVSFIAGAQSFLQNQGDLAESALAGTGAAVKTGLGGAAVAALSNETIKFRPAIKRINTTIGIYMPDTVMASYNHDYNAVSATDALGKLGLASALGKSITSSWNDTTSEDSVSEVFKQVGLSPGGREVLGGLAESSGLVGPGFTDLTLKSAGLAVNPQVELMYRGTANRSFIFEFKFQPRSAKEANEIYQIIKTFKMFSAPSIRPESKGRYFIAPANFDIRFQFGDTENKWISKISTCVLEAVDVNYAGAGQFSSFTDGVPIDIAVQLRFKETDIITRELIEKDNY